MRAHDALYMNIAEYFRPAYSMEGADKVVSTDLPPIYFQHQGMKTSPFSPRYIIDSLSLDVRPFYDHRWFRNP